MLRFYLTLALVFSISFVCAEPSGAEGNGKPLPSVQANQAVPPDTQTDAQNPPPTQPGASAPATDSNQSNTKPADQPTSPSKQQPSRILGVMPNFRAVSAGVIPPPPTPKQAFVIATNNSFDYSSFIFVGLTSMIAEGSNAHPQLGKGVPGFGRYYWRGFLDKTDGNYLVIFALPTVFDQDERYYAKGQGAFLKRFSYAVTRILITPNYSGHST